MKLKNLLLVVCCMGALSSYAENVIQVVPTTTRPGVTTDDAAFLSFEMINTDAIIGYEFKIKLPEGMDFDDSDPVNAPPFELTLDPRYPYTGRTKVYQHSLNYTKLDDGWWYVIVSSSQLNPLKGNSGEIMKGYFTTTATMAPGVYPITIKETVLGISGTEKAETPEIAVSYVTVSEDGTTNPVSTSTDVNLSDMTGYVPSFIIENLNAELATNTNIRSIDMSGATELGAELEIPQNVVYAVATKGGLRRTFDSAKKSTVCLPFPLNAEQVEVVKARGCEIEILKSYNPANNTVSFEPVTEMAANTPYLVTSDNGIDVFGDLSGIALGSMAATTDVVVSDGLSMKGTFNKQTISSDSEKTYFAYNAANGKFVRIGNNATVNHFRAYLMMNTASSTRELTIDDGGSTGIVEVKQTSDNSEYYTLQGIKTNKATQGIYIRNNKKYVVK